MKTLAVLVFMAATTAPPPAPASGRLAFPQVWVDSKAGAFHAPGCKRITESMPRIARTVAKMQQLAPAPECAETDEQAKKRWPAERAKLTDIRQGGVSVGSGSMPDLPRGAAATPASPETRPRTPPPETPATRDSTIIAFCSAEWGSDYAMVAYCQKKQQAAKDTLDRGNSTYRTNDAIYAGIHRECHHEWGNDFAMRVYCEKKQVDAYEQLNRR